MRKKLRISDIAFAVWASILILFLRDEEYGYPKKSAKKAKKKSNIINNFEISDAVFKKFASRTDWKKSREMGKEKLKEKVSIPENCEYDIEAIKAREIMEQIGRGEI